MIVKHDDSEGQNKRRHHIENPIASDYIYDENFNDPLFKYLDKLETVISKALNFGCQDELNFLGESKAEGKLRINLYLKTQILEEGDALIKCEHCLAPVTSKMIPEVKFRAIFENRDYVLAQNNVNLDEDTPVSLN